MNSSVDPCRVKEVINRRMTEAISKPGAPGTWEVPDRTGAKGSGILIPPCPLLGSAEILALVPMKGPPWWRLGARPSLPIELFNCVVNVVAAAVETLWVTVGGGVGPAPRWYSSEWELGAGGLRRGHPSCPCGIEECQGVQEMTFTNPVLDA